MNVVIGSVLGCYKHNYYSRTSSVAVIYFSTDIQKAGIAVCKTHLDEWLDSADDGNVPEPIDIEWLK